MNASRIYLSCQSHLAESRDRSPGVTIFIMTSRPSDEHDLPAPEIPGGEPPGPAGSPAPAGAAPGIDSVTKATRISGTWIAVIVATIVLVFLLVFILQNLGEVTVSFLGISGNLPLGVALLFAAIVGAALVILIGAARILQLRRRVRRASTP
jgi:uncharacterized integral membrane protein